MNYSITRPINLDDAVVLLRNYHDKTVLNPPLRKMFHDFVEKIAEIDYVMARSLFIDICNCNNWRKSDKKAINNLRLVIMDALYHHYQFLPRGDYGYSLYVTRDLKFFAKQCLQVLPEEVATLVSGGSSGCALASAMLTLSDRELNHYHIYTMDGKTHRGLDSWDKNSGFWGKGREKHVTAIVDDLIDGGTTVRSLFTKVHNIEAIQLKYIILMEAFADPCGERIKDIEKDLGVKILYGDVRRKVVENGQ